ncbi:hypothetical protein HK100_011165 [Physocladia obscura]|uniref:BZIP domain-containing protein n=1 Tax=Physocladia obscura TaxID=109957 RepID=A0AAD5XHY3_9FUNG|nr:hypothetical protein HK100_011165 [Physocladia obscura]
MNGKNETDGYCSSVTSNEQSQSVTGEKQDQNLQPEEFEPILPRKKGRPKTLPASKRSIQVRNAQKAYRERKEARVIQLEERVAELTAALASATSVGSAVSANPNVNRSCTNCRVLQMQLAEKQERIKALESIVETSFGDGASLSEASLFGGMYLCGDNADGASQSKCTSPTMIAPTNSETYPPGVYNSGYQQVSSVENLHIPSPRYPTVNIVPSANSLFGAPVGSKLWSQALRDLPSLGNSLSLIEDRHDLFKALLESTDPAFIKTKIIMLEHFRYRIFEAASVLDRYRAVEIFDHDDEIHRSLFTHLFQVSKNALEADRKSGSSSSNIFVPDNIGDARIMLPQNPMLQADIQNELSVRLQQFKDSVRQIPSFLSEKAMSMLDNLSNMFQTVTEIQYQNDFYDHVTCRNHVTESVIHVCDENFHTAQKSRNTQTEQKMDWQNAEFGEEYSNDGDSANGNDERGGSNSINGNSNNATINTTKAKAETTGKSRRRKRPAEPASAAKRAIQVRNAQRTYRQRKEERMEMLEAQVELLKEQLRETQALQQASVGATTAASNTDGANNSIRNNSTSNNSNQPGANTACRHCHSVELRLALSRDKIARLEQRLATLELTTSGISPENAEIREQFRLELSLKHASPPATSTTASPDGSVSPSLPSTSARSIEISRVKNVSSPMSVNGAPSGVKSGNQALKDLPSLQNSFHLIDELSAAFLTQIESTDPVYIKKQLILIEVLKFKILDAASLIDRHKAVGIFDYGYTLHRSFFEYAQQAAKSVFGGDIVLSRKYNEWRSYAKKESSTILQELSPLVPRFIDSAKQIPSLASEKAEKLLKELCDIYAV